MVGSYPNVPSRRMAYDADGTVVQGVAAGFNSTDFPTQADGVPPPVPYETHASQSVQNVNNEAVDVAYSLQAGSTTHAWMVWQLIFPELREIDGYYWNATSVDHSDWLYYSGDTTSGRDGSWSALGSEVLNTATTLEAYRNSIQSAAVNNVRSVTALMVRASSGFMQFRRFHVYGEISAGETPDRLLWVDNDTGSEFGLPIDYGDIPRGSAEEREVKLRNNSGSLTAASVQITGEALYLDSGSWYTFKEAGGSLQSTLPLSSSIGSGADSPVLTIRRVTPDDETTGLHAGRAFVTVGSWS